MQQQVNILIWEECGSCPFVQPLWDDDQVFVIAGEKSREGGSPGVVSKVSGSMKRIQEGGQSLQRKRNCDEVEVVDCGL